MIRPLFLVPLAAGLALAGCGGGDADETDLEAATTDGEAEALADALPAGDFMDLKLGAKIEGPQGPEVVSAFSNAEGAFADVRSYVACPAGIDPCDPNTAPAGTVYTYVHVVTPGEDNDPDEGAGKGPDNSRVELANAFVMTEPAHGFTGKAGYSKAEAAAAMGALGKVVITCDRGMLVWTLDAGDGGNQWNYQEPVTFWWQSTQPPAGPVEAYEIRADRTTAKGKAPYPARSETVKNACYDAEAAKQ
jgi:hypothetical protein